MTIKAQYHFNTDAPCVKQAWENEPNFLIQDFASPDPQQSYCAIYFSSNDIYFPNTEDVFRKRIVEKNYFEWYGTRISRATKHIFVRDVFKQWYIRGINAQCNNIEALADLLKEEARGMKVVTVGSSAGGYAAIVLGSLLQAECVLAFNAQLDLNLLTSRNPFVALYQDTKWGGYFSTQLHINPNTQYFYFYSHLSPQDMQQCHAMPELPNFHRVAFRTSHHGIPFLKVALPRVLNMPIEQLLSLSGKSMHPLTFSIRQAGLLKCASGLMQQIWNKYKRRK